MATESAGSTSTSSLVKSLQQASGTDKKASKGDIGKNEFLNMLVTQLKNQDPLDPMDGDQFAVDLAQFSQVEQLININDKLDATGTKGGDSASLASYLGHEVLLDKKTVDVEAGNGGLLRANIPSDATDVTVALLDKGGNTVGTVSLGARAKGDQSLMLNDLDVPNGSYTYQLSMTTAAGGQTKLLARPGGVVDGFVPGPNPKLLIAGKEVDPAGVKAVLAPTQL
jgi:flagellar basal-body rod modification protein FlgD